MTTPDPTRFLVDACLEIAAGDQFGGHYRGTLDATATKIADIAARPGAPPPARLAVAAFRLFRAAEAPGGTSREGSEGRTVNIRLAWEGGDRLGIAAPLDIVTILVAEEPHE